jgi:hypothetical protein
LFALKNNLKDEKIDNNEFDKIINLLDFHNVVLGFSNNSNKDNKYLLNYLSKNKDNIKYENLYGFLLGLGTENKSSLSTKEDFENSILFKNIYKADKQLTKYVLSKIENHLQYNSSKGMQEIVSFNSSISIEHIIPNNLGNDDKDKIDEMLHHNKAQCLGNLSLLMPKPNAGIGNDTYAIKKERYFKSKLFINNKELIEKFDNFELNITKNDIDLRGKNLTKLIYDT